MVSKAANTGGNVGTCQHVRLVCLLPGDIGHHILILKCMYLSKVFKKCLCNLDIKMNLRSECLSKHSIYTRDIKATLYFFLTSLCFKKDASQSQEE